MSAPTLSAISPCFIISHVEPTIAFYCDNLGFEVRFLAPDQDPFFAIIGRDGVQLFLKAEGGIAPVPNHSRHPHLAWDAFVYVADPDAIAADFTARGAAFTGPLSETHDGLRGFEVTDPDGYVLFFGRPSSAA